MLRKPENFKVKLTLGWKRVREEERGECQKNVVQNYLRRNKENL